MEDHHVSNKSNCIEIGTSIGHFLLPACTLNSQRPHFQFKIGKKNYTFCLPTLTRMFGLSQKTCTAARDVLTDKKTVSLKISSTSISSSHQMMLNQDKCNDPWGDSWAILTTARTFWIVSKNTGTMNPQNLDLQAITHELLHLGASVFAAQETNIHWDTLTSYQIYQQFKSLAPQIKLTMASSQELTTD